MKFKVRHQNVACIFLFATTLTLFSVNLIPREFIGFEARFALFLKEALRHGLSFFPTIYGTPYPDYTAFATLLMVISTTILGSMSHISATLPFAMAASATCVITYQLVRPLSERWAWMSVLLLLSTLTFTAQARTIAYDQLVTLVTICVFYLVYRNKFSIKLLLILVTALSIGFLARGPIGLILPTGVIASYYCIERDFKTLLIVLLTTACCLLTLSILLLFAAKIQGGNTFASAVIHMQATSRIHGLKMVDPFTRYFTQSLGNYAPAFPLALIVMCGLNRRLMKMTTPQERLIAFLVGYTAIILLGMSFSNRKPSHYVLAMSPALAIIAAYFFEFEQWGMLLSNFKKTIERAILFLPIILVSTIYLLTLTLDKPDIIAQLPITTTVFGFLLLQLCLISALIIQPKHRTVMVVATLSACMWWTQISLLEPIDQILNRTSDFVNRAANLMRVHHAPLIFYGIGRDGLAIKWMINADESFVPSFINNLEQVHHIDYPSLLIAKMKDAVELKNSLGHSTRTVAIGKIGHNQVEILLYNRLSKPHENT